MLYDLETVLSALAAVSKCTSTEYPHIAIWTDGARLHVVGMGNTLAAHWSIPEGARTHAFDAAGLLDTSDASPAMVSASTPWRTHARAVHNIKGKTVCAGIRLSGVSWVLDSDTFGAVSSVPTTERMPSPAQLFRYMESRTNPHASDKLSIDPAALAKVAAGVGCKGAVRMESIRECVWHVTDAVDVSQYTGVTRRGLLCGLSLSVPVSKPATVEPAKDPDDAKVVCTLADLDEGCAWAVAFFEREGIPPELRAAVRTVKACGDDPHPETIRKEAVALGRLAAHVVGYGRKRYGLAPESPAYKSAQSALETSAAFRNFGK
jgi:hypothetical protein